jgi:hypothetical protein
MKAWDLTASRYLEPDLSEVWLDKPGVQFTARHQGAWPKAEASR